MDTLSHLKIAFQSQDFASLDEFVYKNESHW